MSDIVDVILRLRAEAETGDLDKLGNKLKGIDKSVEEVARASTKQRNLYKEQLGAIDQLRVREQRLMDLRAKSNDVSRVQRFNAELEKTRKAITSLTTSKPIALPSVPKQATQSNGIGLGSIVGGGLIAGAITGIASGLKDIAGEVINTTIEFEKFGAVLENSLGKQGGAEAFTLIKDFAKETPFQVAEITDSFIKLVNRGFTPTKAELTKIGDIASSQGKSFGQLTEAILDAQTGEFERLKEFGIKASKNGDQVKLSFKGVTKEVKNTDEAIRNAILGFGELPGILGANAKISETLGGKVSNLKDNFSQLFANIGNGTSGVMKDLVDGANEIVGAFVDITKNSPSDSLKKTSENLTELKLELINSADAEKSRADTISKLQEQYPAFISSINLEKLTTNELIGVIDNINQSYREQYKIKKAFEDVDNLNIQRKKVSKIQDDEEIEFYKTLNNAIEEAYKQQGLSEGKALQNTTKYLTQLRAKYSNNLTDINKQVSKDFGDLPGFFTDKNLRDAAQRYELSKYRAEALNKDIKNQTNKANSIQKALDPFGINQLQQDLNEVLTDIDKLDIGKINEALSKVNNFRVAGSKGNRPDIIQEANNIELKLEEAKANKLNALYEKDALANDAKNKKKAKSNSNSKDEAKKLQEKELKDFESFVKEKEKLQAEIDKINLPKGETESSIAKRLDLERKAEIKAINEKLKDSSKSASIQEQARQILLKIDEKYNLIQLDDLKEFNEKKAKLLLELNDRINKDAEAIEIDRLKLQEDSYDKEIKLLQFSNRDRLAQIESNFDAERKAIEAERAKLTLPSPDEEKFNKLELQNEKNKQEAKLSLLKEYEDKQRDLAFKYFEQSIKDLEEINKEQIESIKLDYLVRETELNNSLNNGLISQKKYDSEIRKLEDERAKDISNNTINNLNKEKNKIDAIIKLYKNLTIVAGSLGVTVPKLTPAQVNELETQSKEIGKQIAEAQNEASKPKAEKASASLKNLVESEDFKAIVSTITAVNNAFTSVNEALQSQIENIGNAIEKQADRVSKYRENADRGGAEQYKREVERLNSLEVEREKVLKRQRAIQKAQVIANQALAISNGIVAITEQTKYPFPYNVIAVSATIASLIAGIAAAKQQLSANKFAKGTKYVTRGNNPIGEDTIPAYLNEGERVITTSQNKKYYDLYNKLENDPNFAENLQKQIKYKDVVSTPRINLKSSTEAVNQANNIKVVMANDTQALIKELRGNRNELIGVQNAINEKPVPSLNITSKGLNKVVSHFNKQNEIKKKL